MTVYITPRKMTRPAMALKFGAPEYFSLMLMGLVTAAVLAHGDMLKSLAMVALGLLLGVVWSPCVGPTLGAASVLAAQGRDLGQVALTLLMFAVGTSFPLLLLGLLSREGLTRWHGRLIATGKVGKMALGLVLITTGALILSGFDKSLEAVLVRILPQWLTELATGF